MRRLLLFVVYFLVVTPVGLVGRLVRDPLRRSRGPRVRSYWTPLPPVRSPDRFPDRSPRRSSARSRG
ncbi:hypothetical protein BX285_4284 [Streptomyces sp. 1114.5]|uniref:hypothetical protein n=1 Tax=Streptomyces sp. 1114.5 TaxID=1938830 RepID=UPI000EB49966|nr:hypothetical protein [Streptomyces sp. 1114.5]RKT19814.1 hypothetical protein BX285_4284 [Streptomyces sp. 1114.5]